VPELRALLSGDPQALKRLLVAGGVIAAVGIVVIVVGVLAGWGQTRLIGAGLISIGGVLGGAAIGFSAPMRGQIYQRLSAWRLPIAIVVAVIVAAPAVIASASGAIGPLVGGGDAQDKLLIAVGALIGLLFAVLTVASGVIAVRATLRRVGDRSQVEREAGEGRA
jgi:hypothetical protein